MAGPSQPRNHGQFRRAGRADPAPLLTETDVTRAAKVLAASRSTPAQRAARSAWVWQHVAALRADIERRLAAKAARASQSEKEMPCSM